MGAISWERLKKRDPGPRMRAHAAQAMAVALVGGVGSYSLHRHSGFLEFVLSVLSLSVVWTGSILLHEIGHALAARAVNLQPTVMLVGGGPSLVRREVFGVAFDLGSLPGNGVTMIVNPARQEHVKWRLFATYLGGPVVTIGLLLLGSWVFPGDWRALRAGAAAWIMPGAALVIANGIIVFNIVVPTPKVSDPASLRNDLTQLVTLWWLKPSRLDGLEKAADAARFARLYALRRYQAAFEEGRRLAADPDRWLVRIQLADMLVIEGRYAEAAAAYADLLDDPVLARAGLPPLVMALLDNNYAYASYMLNDGEKLEAADQASARAITAAPNEKSVLGTRGAILVEQGQVTAGRKLLKRALRLHSDPVSRANVLCCLAMAAAREGERKEARRLLTRARRLDRDCDVLPRAERALMGPAR